MLGQKFMAALTMAIVRTFENCGRLKMGQGPKNRPYFRVGLGPTSERALGSFALRFSLIPLPTPSPITTAS